MTRMPSGLISSLNCNLQTEEIDSVKEWWSALTKELRTELYNLWDKRNESCRYSAIKDDRGKYRWQHVPVICGRFVDSDKAEKNEHWHQDLYEFLVNNPDEIFLVEQFKIRTFHICTSTDVAQKVLKMGIIPADLQCPLAIKDCRSMNMLNLQPGRSIMLFDINFDGDFDDVAIN